MKKLFYTIAVLILALGYLAPFSVSAQSGRKPVTPLCFFKAVQGDPYVQYASRDANGVAQCPSPQTGFELLNPSGQTDQSVVAVCWKRDGQAPNFNYTLAITYDATVTGQPVCDSDLTNFILRSQFRAAGSTSGGNTGGTGTGGTGTGGTGTGGTGTGTGTGGSTGSTTNPDCSDPNFHAAGPLCLPNNPFANSSGVAGSGSISDLAVKVIKALLFFAGIVAVVMIIIGGYLYMTARGNDIQATNGRKTLTNAIIGLVIIILAYVIVQAVYNFLAK